MPTYNKLVRDLIPQIIERNQKAFSIRTLTDEEWITELKTKFHEEWDEYLSASTSKEQTEELADLLEIIFTLAQAAGTNQEELLRIAVKKRAERGGFSQKVYLIEVTDDE
ncbi:nucleoside triphosphate pyrophosphohydrolase [Paenibacillus cremeus]|uniref:Phosphoribosyl-ATP pyrophosphohydrolase n=1 Tax=Paenibacillus cremeus TaxID=2163881 RepID=A0A559JHR2_9BACL|nr:nucleoside triphosphate pyrophosphohydrolase [Paenibacillus cremeus]TVX99397.1 phosphoribosyl-ATP pyrophosphohydrolase [Paenibacillus cremeus]